MKFTLATQLLKHEAAVLRDYIKFMSRRSTSKPINAADAAYRADRCKAMQPQLNSCRKQLSQLTSEIQAIQAIEALGITPALPTTNSNKATTNRNQ